MPGVKKAWASMALPMWKTPQHMELQTEKTMMTLISPDAMRGEEGSKEVKRLGERLAQYE